MNKPILLSFSDTQALAQLFAKQLEIPHFVVNSHYFPDGECKITLPQVEGNRLIILRSLNQPNAKLTELLFTVETARQMKFEHISLIAPYMCYMRQDTAFTPGEAVSQKIIGRFLANLFDQVITVDAHLHRVDSLEQAIPAKQVCNLTAAESIGKFIFEKVQAPVLIGPDAESEQWVSVAAAPHKLPYYVARKTRQGDQSVRIELPDIDVKNKNVVIVDDVASTCETIIQTALQLTKSGAKSISCTVTHALFPDQVLAKLLDNGIKDVWSSNSIEHKTNAIDIAPLLARAYGA